MNAMLEAAARNVVRNWWNMALFEERLVQAIVKLCQSERETAAAEARRALLEALVDQSGLP